MSFYWPLNIPWYFLFRVCFFFLKSQFILVECVKGRKCRQGKTKLIHYISKDILSAYLCSVTQMCCTSVSGQESGVRSNVNWNTI